MNVCLDKFKVRALFQGSFEFIQDVTEVQMPEVYTCPKLCAVLLRNSMQWDGEKSLKIRKIIDRTIFFSLIHVTSIPKFMEGFYERIYKLYVMAFHSSMPLPLNIW